MNLAECWSSVMQADVREMCAASMSQDGLKPEVRYSVREGFYTTTFKTAKEVLNIEERFCKQEGFARVLANTIRNNVYDFRENYEFIGSGMPEYV